MTHSKIDLCSKKPSGGFYFLHHLITHTLWYNTPYSVLDCKHFWFKISEALCAMRTLFSTFIQPNQKQSHIYKGASTIQVNCTAFLQPYVNS